MLKLLINLLRKILPRPRFEPGSLVFHTSVRSNIFPISRNYLISLLSTFCLTIHKSLSFPLLKFLESISWWNRAAFFLLLYPLYSINLIETPSIPTDCNFLRLDLHTNFVSKIAYPSPVCSEFMSSLFF